LFSKRKNSFVLLLAAICFAAVPVAPAAHAQGTELYFEGTTAEFITICEPVSETCLVNFEFEAEFSELLGVGCAPDGLSYEDMLISVRDWLRARRETHRADWERSVEIALGALWPCPG